jgi:hypothetical protein
MDGAVEQERSGETPFRQYFQQAAGLICRTQDRRTHHDTARKQALRAL